MNRTKKPLPSRPFFARFLEQQQLREVAGGTEGSIVPVGTIVTTMKYPSDNDEGGFEPPP